MKPLDIVLVESQMAVIREISSNGEASIIYIGDVGGKTAWFRSDEIEVIDSIPAVIARMAVHPSSEGNAIKFYPFPEKP
jgi:hypothetical protein